MLILCPKWKVLIKWLHIYYLWIVFENIVYLFIMNVCYLFICCFVYLHSALAWEILSRWHDESINSQNFANVLVYRGRKIHFYTFLGKCKIKYMKCYRFWDFAPDFHVVSAPWPHSWSSLSLRSTLCSKKTWPHFRW